VQLSAAFQISTRVTLIAPCLPLQLDTSLRLRGRHAGAPSGARVGYFADPKRAALFGAGGDAPDGAAWEEGDDEDDGGGGCDDGASFDGSMGSTRDVGSTRDAGSARRGSATGGGGAAAWPQEQGAGSASSGADAGASASSARSPGSARPGLRVRSPTRLLPGSKLQPGSLSSTGRASFPGFNGTTSAAMRAAALHMLSGAGGGPAPGSSGSGGHDDSFVTHSLGEGSGGSPTHGDGGTEADAAFASSERDPHAADGDLPPHGAHGAGPARDVIRSTDSRSSASASAGRRLTASSVTSSAASSLSRYGAAAVGAASASLSAARSAGRSAGRSAPRGSTASGADLTDADGAASAASAGAALLPGGSPSLLALRPGHPPHPRRRTVPKLSPAAALLAQHRSAAGAVAAPGAGGGADRSHPAGSAASGDASAASSAAEAGEDVSAAFMGSHGGTRMDEDDAAAPASAAHSVTGGASFASLFSASAASAAAATIGPGAAAGAGGVGADAAPSKPPRAKLPLKRADLVFCAFIVAATPQCLRLRTRWKPPQPRAAPTSADEAAAAAAGGATQRRRSAPLIADGSAAIVRVPIPNVSPVGHLQALRAAAAQAGRPLQAPDAARGAEAVLLAGPRKYKKRVKPAAVADSAAASSAFAGARSPAGGVSAYGGARSVSSSSRGARGFLAAADGAAESSADLVAPHAPPSHLPPRASSRGGYDAEHGGRSLSRASASTAAAHALGLNAGLAGGLDGGLDGGLHGAFDGGLDGALPHHPEDDALGDAFSDAGDVDGHTDASGYHHHEGCAAAGGCCADGASGMCSRQQFAYDDDEEEEGEGEGGDDGADAGFAAQLVAAQAAAAAEDGSAAMAGVTAGSASSGYDVASHAATPSSLRHAPAAVLGQLDPLALPPAGVVGIGLGLTFDPISHAEGSAAAEGAGAAAGFAPYSAGSGGGGSSTASRPSSRAATPVAPLQLGFASPPSSVGRPFPARPPSVAGSVASCGGAAGAADGAGLPRRSPGARSAAGACATPQSAASHRDRTDSVFSSDARTPAPYAGSHAGSYAGGSAAPGPRGVSASPTGSAPAPCGSAGGNAGAGLPRKRSFREMHDGAAASVPPSPASAARGLLVASGRRIPAFAPGADQGGSCAASTGGVLSPGLPGSGASPQFSGLSIMSPAGGAPAATGAAGAGASQATGGRRSRQPSVFSVLEAHEEGEEGERVPDDGAAVPDAAAAAGLTHGGLEPPQEAEGADAFAPVTAPSAQRRRLAAHSAALHGEDAGTAHSSGRASALRATPLCDADASGAARRSGGGRHQDVAPMDHSGPDLLPAFDMGSLHHQPSTRSAPPPAQSPHRSVSRGPSRLPGTEHLADRVHPAASLHGGDDDVGGGSGGDGVVFGGLGSLAAPMPIAAASCAYPQRVGHAAVQQLHSNGGTPLVRGIAGPGFVSAPAVPALGAAALPGTSFQGHAFGTGGNHGHFLHQGSQSSSQGSSQGGSAAALLQPQVPMPSALLQYTRGAAALDAAAATDGQRAASTTGGAADFDGPSRSHSGYRTPPAAASASSVLAGGTSLPPGLSSPDPGGVGLTSTHGSSSSVPCAAPRHGAWGHPAAAFATPQPAGGSASFDPDSFLAH